MIVVMQQGATDLQVEAVIDRMVDMGFDVHRSTGVIHTVLGGVGGREDFDVAVFEVMDGVKEAHRIASPYKLASRPFRPGGTVVKVGGIEFGGPKVVVMAGPASVESRDQIEQIAAAVAQAGAKVLRGGSLRPNQPYGFEPLARAMPPRAERPGGLRPGDAPPRAHQSTQATSTGEGAEEESLKLLREAADRNGLLVASEVTDHTMIPMVAAYADILQVNARNMQNFNLLRELGRQRRPVLLKRGVAARIEDLLVSAEYILAGGNYDVILCERGIRTFETYTRHTMDISAIPVVKKLSHLPILADPSQGTGRRDKVPAMARAAVAAGADGLLIEVHPDPDRALSDGAQLLNLDQFAGLMAQLRMIAPAVERSL